MRRDAYGVLLDFDDETFVRKVGSTWSLDASYLQFVSSYLPAHRRVEHFLVAKDAARVHDLIEHIRAIPEGAVTSPYDSLRGRHASLLHAYVQCLLGTAGSAFGERSKGQAVCEFLERDQHLASVQRFLREPEVSCTFMENLRLLICPCTEVDRPCVRVVVD
jgi:hypothetical protein